MSQTLLPHLSLPLYFQPTCQPHCYLMALLVEAEMGEKRREKKKGVKNRRRTLHSQTKPLPRKKKALLVPLFKMNRSISLSCLKQKSGLQQWKWDKNLKKKKSLCRLESSTLPCVSFRALERLNQCRRQLEAVGEELQGASLQSLSGEMWTDRFICRKVMNFSYS